MLKIKLMGLFFGLILIHGLANAGVKTYQFTGSEIYHDTSLGVSSDSFVTGTFSYDVNAHVDYDLTSYAPGEYGLFTHVAADAFTFNWNGHSLTSSIVQYSVYANINSNVPDYFVVAAYDPTYDGVLISGGYVALTLGSLTDGEALTSASPPTSLNFSLFDQPSFNRASFHNDTGLNLLSFNVLSISAVPELETYSMLLMGIGVIGFMTRRRKL